MKFLLAILLANASYHSVNASHINQEDTKEIQSDGTSSDGLIFNWKIRIRESTLAPPPPKDKPINRPTKEKNQRLKEQEKITKQNAKATKRLQNILIRFQSKCGSNLEFCWWICKVRYASRLGKNHLNEKIETRLMFRIYNRRRLKLEHDIDFRIDDLDHLKFEQERDSKCVDFYQMQQRTLQKSLRLTNAQKEAKLRENSITCPYPDIDYYIVNSDEDYKYVAYTFSDSDDDYYSK